MDDHVSRIIDMEMSINDVDTCWRTWGWTDPTWDTVRTLCHQLISYNVYANSLDLRSSYVLEMRKDLLWGYQTLHRNWVVIKVAFGFVKKHASRHGWSRWDLPLRATGEISLGHSNDRIQKNVWPYSRLSVNRVSGIPSHGNRERGLS